MPKRGTGGSFPGLPGEASDVYNTLEGRIQQVEYDAKFGLGNAYISNVADDVRSVYVSNAGSDTTGDGSRAKPWATVVKAMQMAPDYCQSTVTTSVFFTYQIRCIAPYTAPIGTWTMPAVNVNGPGFTQLRIQVVSWPADETLFNTATDPRFTYLLNNITPTGAAQYSTNRLLYTLPAATLSTNDEHMGELVRIFNAGVEVARGWIFRSVAGGTQQIYVHTRQTFTAQTSDRLYICRPSTVFGTPTSSLIQGSLVTRNLLEFHTCRIIDNLSLQGAFILGGGPNNQFVANGGSGSIVTGMSSTFDMSNFSNLSVFPVTEQTVRQPPCVYRTGGGFLGSGNIVISGCWLGNYQTLIGFYSTLTLHGCTFKGQINSGVFGNMNVYVNGFATSSSPLLFIPTTAVTGGHILVTFNSVFIMDPSSFMNVETTLAGGDLIRVRNQSVAMCPGTIRPVSTPALAAGLVMNVTNDGFGMINTASTILGAVVGQDVKAGGTAATTIVGLTRTSEAATFATIIAGNAL